MQINKDMNESEENEMFVEDCNQYQWAKAEVLGAIKREHENNEEDTFQDQTGFDYVGECYKSALKAYRSLLEDDHSGMSFSITASILKKLMDNKPLYPIIEEEGIWNIITGNPDYDEYQCRRMSSLFKKVYKDGRVEYSDVNRLSCIDIHSHCGYHSGFFSRLIQNNFPITLPYIAERFTAECEDFLTDKKNGDFDTIAMYTLKGDYNGKEISIKDLKEYRDGESGLFFTVGSDGEFHQISEKEYKELKARRLIRE